MILKPLPISAQKAKVHKNQSLVKVHKNQKLTQSRNNSHKNSLKTLADIAIMSAFINVMAVHNRFLKKKLQ